MRVIIDRSTCISCGMCWETCPEYFEQNEDDNFSEVIESYRTGCERGEGTVPESLIACVREAADLCPVSIIHIEE